MMNFKQKWKKFDDWFNGCDWRDQQRKIEELFPLTNWIQIWQVFNTICNNLLISFSSTNWEEEQEILEFLIKHYGEKS